MIEAHDLNRCIDLLAEINLTADSNTKRKILEIGYILKQELDIVSDWNAQQAREKKTGRHSEIDVRKLMEDNTQLFNECHKLQELNVKLKQVIDEKIPYIEHAINGVNDKVGVLTESINKL